MLLVLVHDVCPCVGAWPEIHEFGVILPPVFFQTQWQSLMPVSIGLSEHQSMGHVILMLQYPRPAVSLSL